MTDLVLASGATAVVAYNDEIAAGVVNRLADCGIGVPGDVSVVGFDDTGLAEMVTPRLTTVRIPATAAGTAAIELLLDLVRGRDGDVVRGPREICGELIVRSSTGTSRTAPVAGRGAAP